MNRSIRSNLFRLEYLGHDSLRPSAIVSLQWLAIPSEFNVSRLYSQQRITLRSSLIALFFLHQQTSALSLFSAWILCLTLCMPFDVLTSRQSKEESPRQNKLPPCLQRCLSQPV